MFSDKEKDLMRHMRQLKVFEKDIQESFIRSSGPGGQNVNKVATCVVLHHIPTGFQVKCQAQRSREFNRHQARYLLVRKIEKEITVRRLKNQQEREKIKRQTRKKPRYLKEKILEEKKCRSQKKEARRKINL